MRLVKLSMRRGAEYYGDRGGTGLYAGHAFTFTESTIPMHVCSHRVPLTGTCQMNGSVFGRQSIN